MEEEIARRERYPDWSFDAKYLPAMRSVWEQVKAGQRGAIFYDDDGEASNGAVAVVPTEMIDTDLQGIPAEVADPPKWNPLEDPEVKDTFHVNEEQRKAVAAPGEMIAGIDVHWGPVDETVKEPATKAILRMKETWPDIAPENVYLMGPDTYGSEAFTHFDPDLPGFQILLDGANQPVDRTRKARLRELYNEGQIPAGTMLNPVGYTVYHEWGHGIDHVLNYGIFSPHMKGRVHAKWLRKYRQVMADVLQGLVDHQRVSPDTMDSLREAGALAPATPEIPTASPPGSLIRWLPSCR